jgi:hypothetical protein
LINLLPRFLTDDQLKTLKQETFEEEKYAFLQKIPGGEDLLQRIKAA